MEIDCSLHKNFKAPSSSTSEMAPSSSTSFIPQTLQTPCAKQESTTFIGAFKIPLITSEQTYFGQLPPSTKKPTFAETLKLTPPATSAKSEPKVVDSKLMQFIEGSLQLKTTSIYQGKPSVTFKYSEKRSLIERLGHVLIAKFSHGRPALVEIKRFLNNLHLQGNFRVSIFDLKHVMIECVCFHDFAKIWIKRSWNIKGFPVRIFKWTEDFVSNKESTICPLWIHLPKLPLYLYEEATLLSIANTIGKPLFVDKKNLNRTKIDYASICVEYDVHRPQVDEIWIGFESDSFKDKLEGFWQKVVYNDIPTFCVECHHLGHSYAFCKRKKEKIGKYLDRIVQSSGASDATRKCVVPGDSMYAAILAEGVPGASTSAELVRGTGVSDTRENYAGGIAGKENAGTSRAQSGTAVTSPVQGAGMPGNAAPDTSSAGMSSSAGEVYEDQILHFSEVVCGDKVAATGYRGESETPAASKNDAAGCADPNGVAPVSPGLFAEERNDEQQEFADIVTGTTQLNSDGDFANEGDNAAGVNDADVAGLLTAVQGFILDSTGSKISSHHSTYIEGKLQGGFGYEKSVVSMEQVGNMLLQQNAGNLVEQVDAIKGRRQIEGMLVKSMVQAAILGTASEFQLVEEKGTDCNSNTEEQVTEAENNFNTKCRNSNTASITPRKLSSAAAEFTPKWAVLVEELVEDKKQTDPVLVQKEVDHHGPQVTRFGSPFLSDDMGDIICAFKCKSVPNSPSRSRKQSKSLYDSPVYSPATIALCKKYGAYTSDDSDGSWKDYD